MSSRASETLLDNRDTLPRRAPAPHSGPGDLQTLVDRYLQEQSRLTAVERFSHWHSRPHEETELARIYRKRLPASPPGPGQQYAFEVDLGLCTGCKACVTACHSLNGLEPQETWRSVGLLVDPHGATASQHVTTACHHCVDPACLNGCPVLAYEKDPVTGIVRHLDDQCIGCSYCTLMCPYEVPQYSTRLGIVRKCDLCQARLQHGEAPACVQGCPNGAIRIDFVDTAALVSRFRPTANSQHTALFLPDSPAPELTVPTTRYLSPPGRPIPTLAADHHRLHPQPSHTPLTFFLVLSQASVGILLADILGAANRPLSEHVALPLALIVQLIALAIATTHLGQPLRAWRSFLGWRRSWFSREIIAFGLYTGLLAGLAFAPGSLPQPILSVSRALTGAVGLAAIATSAMIYAATRRQMWSTAPTSVRFFGTTVLVAAAAGLGALPAAAIAGMTLACKTLVETAPMRRGHETDWNRSRSLLIGPLKQRWRARIALAGSGLALLLLRLAPVPIEASALVATASLLLLLGEILERHLFFTSVSPQRMPGGLHT